MGPDPVFPNILEIPAGVILVTLLLSRFDIYRLPTESIVIPLGTDPVVPNTLDIPDGVVLFTLLLL